MEENELDLSKLTVDELLDIQIECINLEALANKVLNS